MTTRRLDDSDGNVPRREDLARGALAGELLDLPGRQFDPEPRFQGDDELDVFERVPSRDSGKRRVVANWRGLVVEQVKYELIEFRHL